MLSRKEKRSRSFGWRCSANARCHSAIKGVCESLVDTPFEGSIKMKETLDIVMRLVG